PGFFKQLRRTGWRILSVWILAILFIVFCFYTPENNSDWLLGAYSYEYLGVEDLYGSLIRIVQYILMLLAVFFSLSLMPNTHCTFTILERRILYIYLKHGIIIQAFRNFIPVEVYNSLSSHLVMVILLTLIIVDILGSRLVQKYTDPVVEIG